MTFSGSNVDAPVYPELTIQNITFDTTAPDILNILPTQDSFISSADVDYELSEKLGSGKIKFINTTDNTEDEINLTGSELNAGQKTLGALTNAPTLTHGKTYTIEINGTDLAGNNAVTQSVTGLKYEVPSSKLASLTIPLNGFTFDADTITYSLTTNSSSINIAYQEASNNIDHITVKDGSDVDIASITPLPLNVGDNVIKITITSKFTGTAPITYTVTINKLDLAQKTAASKTAAALQNNAIDNALVDQVDGVATTAWANTVGSGVKTLETSMITAIKAISGDPKKIKYAMTSLLTNLVASTNTDSIDINNAIEIPATAFEFASANIPLKSGETLADKKINIISPTSIPVSLDNMNNGLYVPLSIGEIMKFNISYPNTTQGNYNSGSVYEISFTATNDTQFSFTLDSFLEAYTKINGIVYDYSNVNHTLLTSGDIVNINGNVIIIGSVLFGGNDGSGTSDPYAISTTDQLVLTTGLDAIIEETNRGSLKIKALNATMNAKLKELLVDTSESADIKRKKRDNALNIILSHANMGTSTAIKIPKSDLGFTLEMSANALSVIVFKTSSSVTTLDVIELNNTESFYVPLNKNSQFGVNLGNNVVSTFVRTDEITEKYTLTVTGSPKLIKTTDCNNLILDSNNNLVSGYLIPGDVVQIANRIFFIGMIGDGGQSIILEYANVTWTNVYDPNTTSFEDNINAANPTVPLQPYNREINIDGLVIPAGEMKFVKFGNGSTTVNFSN